MSDYNIEKILALIDEKERVDGEGITLAHLNPDKDDWPVIHHCHSMEDLLEKLISEDDLFLKPSSLVEAVYNFHYGAWQNQNPNLTDLKKFYREIEPDDFTFLLTLDGKRVLDWNPMFHFMNEQDAKEFVEAVQYRAYEIIQEDLAKGNEINSLLNRYKN